MYKLTLSDILKDPNVKLKVGKIDFKDPKVIAILEEAKKEQIKLAEQIRRNNSNEGLDKVITI